MEEIVRIEMRIEDLEASLARELDAGDRNQAAWARMELDEARVALGEAHAEINAHFLGVAGELDSLAGSMNHFGGY